MNDALFEQLLYEEESTTLDFKQDQYPFAKENEDEKSELLKDILGFANAWRRTEAYILIGVEDVRGGRADVLGIPNNAHLADHSLQQFVYNLTNRPIHFHYEAFCFEGKQVGVISIEVQERPIYLLRNYGRLKKGEVYIRRGSSIDPSKPATPDEIMRMGMSAAPTTKPTLTVEFGALDRYRILGRHYQFSATLCQMPDSKTLPKLRADNIFTGLSNPVNTNYYEEFAQFIFCTLFFKKLYLVVSNTGECAATDVYLEISIPKNKDFGVIVPSELPRPPRKSLDIFNTPITASISHFQNPGDVQIIANADESKIEIDCGNMQPGRKVWTEGIFLWIRQDGEIEVKGHIFAANLSSPVEFSLFINATITETMMTVNELLSRDEPTGAEWD
ncbi:MAG: ATP-binding protein [Candidatus Hydrogenedentes bacterium]|nr:ATP-binding protein [Candidatus Hydrogenedentota bacterium]